MLASSLIHQHSYLIYSLQGPLQPNYHLIYVQSFNQSLIQGQYLIYYQSFHWNHFLFLSLFLPGIVNLLLLINLLHHLFFYFFLFNSMIVDILRRFDEFQWLTCSVMNWIRFKFLRLTLLFVIGLKVFNKCLSKPVIRLFL